MKKLVSRSLALMLALLMVLSLAACGGGNDDSSNNSSNSNSTSSPTNDNNTPSSNDADTPAPAVKSGSLSVMIYDRGIMPTSEGTLDNNRWTEWIEENCPIENLSWTIIPRTEASQTMFMQFAAGELPDVLPNYEDFPQFYQQGMVMEITDEMLDKMPNFKAILDEYPIVRKSCTVDGKLMYLGKFSNVYENHTMVFRQDWMDNLGLSQPKTVDDLKDIIYAFTYNDPDGNGVDDTWGINLTTDAQRVLSQMFGFPNPEKYAIIDGELTYVWDRMEAWLDFCKWCVDNGCVNPDFLTNKADDDQADFLNGKIGIYCSGRFTNANRYNLFTNFKTNFPDGKLDTYPLPETEFGSFNTYLNGGASTVGFISADCKDVDAACAYINWLYDPEVSEYLHYGPDGVYNKMNDYGTYAPVDAEKNATEYDWASDYSVAWNETLLGREPAISVHANDYYNQDLTSGDPIREEFGMLFYKFFEIANMDNMGDARKWFNDGKPPLPNDLELIRTTADGEVNNQLKASLVDSSKSAAQVIQECKDAWYGAGGQKVDDYYAQWYKDAGDSALLVDDFNNSKDAPELTPAAQEVYDRLSK